MELNHRLKPVVESTLFHRTVEILILINAVIIGMETYPSMNTAYGYLLHLADRTILFLFTVEIAARFLAETPKPNFFKSGWNLFDLIVVGVGYLPASQFFSVVRLFRILRVMRAVTVFPDLQKVVGALLRSLPSLGHILLLIGLLMYVYGAMGTFLYAHLAPQYFGSLHGSLLTLFTIITLEGWTDVLRDVMAVAPYSWIYFASYILFGTYVAMNFFIGVIVHNMETLTEGPDVQLAEVRAALVRIEAKLARARI